MSFSDLVKSYGESAYGGIRNEERFEKWKHVYDNVNKLEKGKHTTFYTVLNIRIVLFSP